jgi:uncharacterized membrane protein YkvA (DUF1232 family)
MNKKTLAIVATVFSVIYLLNPTLGVFEIVPDNIPFIGNLDEATITALLIWAISILRGKEISFRGSVPSKEEKQADAEVVDDK